MNQQLKEKLMDLSRPEMKVLTIDEERELLEEIANGEIKGIDSEMSRLVYGIDDDLIVKVAIGPGGLKQNENEVSAFGDYPFYPIARIYAYGQTCLIMERLDHCGRYDDCYYVDEYLDGDSDRVDQIVVDLETINGDTSDNFQLGLTKNGDLVAYDYGFISSISCNSQTSDLAETVCSEVNDEETLSYIRDLANNLEIMDVEFMAQLEKDRLDEWQSKWNKVTTTITTTIAPNVIQPIGNAVVVMKPTIQQIGKTNTAFTLL